MRYTALSRPQARSANEVPIATMKATYVVDKGNFQGGSQSDQQSGQNHVNRGTYQVEASLVIHDHLALVETAINPVLNRSGHDT